MASERVYSDEFLRVAVDGELCVARWIDSPQPEHFDRVLEGARRAAKSGKTVLLSVVDAPGKKPRFEGPIREAGKRMSEGLSPINAATAHVILMEGFAGATIRMFVSTLTLLGRSGAPTKVFGQLEEGVSWLAAEWKAGSADRIRQAYQLCL